MARTSASSWRRKWAAPDLRHEASAAAVARAGPARRRPGPHRLGPAVASSFRTQTSTSSSRPRRTQSRWTWAQSTLCVPPSSRRPWRRGKGEASGEVLDRPLPRGPRCPARDVGGANRGQVLVGVDQEAVEALLALVATLSSSRPRSAVNTIVELRAAYSSDFMTPAAPSRVGRSRSGGRRRVGAAKDEASRKARRMIPVDRARSTTSRC